MSSKFFINPCITKNHIIDIGKQKISQVEPALVLIANEYNLKLNRVRDFRVAVKVLEDSIISN